MVLRDRILKKNQLHIVSFNIPDPPNYGGVIDIYYKIKCLSKAGIKIYLHCYQYGREKSARLEEFCEQVNYYKRSSGFKYFLSPMPYIIKTRLSEELLGNLRQPLCPILFEGIHTTGFYNHKALNTRHKIIRTHNIEYQYYRNLAGKERNLFKKFFFISEGIKLNRYERRLPDRTVIAAISENDKIYYQKYGYETCYIPAFHPFEKVMSQEGTGKYILYHGDLSVPDNERSVRYLIDKLYKHLRIPLIIAGKDPSKCLKRTINWNQNIKLIENPSSDKLSDMIRNAHINLLHSFQSSGMKIKLLYSLFLGRHCIAHKNIIANSGLDNLCYEWETEDQLIKKVKYLLDKPFTKPESEKRKKKLNDNFSNRENTAQLIRLADLDT